MSVSRRSTPSNIVRDELPDQATAHPTPRRHGLPAGEDRQRRIRNRVLPLIALAGVALLTGVIVGARHVPAERKVANQFAAAWQRGDYVGMYALVGDDVKRGTSVTQFARAYEAAEATATATGISVGRAKDPSGGTVEVPVSVRTRVFGTVRQPIRIPFSGSGDAARVDWSPSLTFPGVPPGSALTRSTTLPERAKIRDRDGNELTGGVAGELGPIPPERSDALRRTGVPDDAQVGISGMQRVFQDRLAGRPGGVLLARGRVLGRAIARKGTPVRSSIDPKIQEAAVVALGARFGSVAVLDPRDGEVLGLAGVAYTGLGPPGSTFKVITTTAALDAKLVKLTDQFPVASGALLSGVRLENANGEFCGGDFEHSFAESCNSVFAPLGAKVGAKRLVAMAERFGFNEKSQIDGAATSTIPAAGQVGDDLAVGSTAIGQGKVQASALQMASVAATIGERGLRFRPSLMYQPHERPVRVTTAAIAATLRRLMVGVVRNGTGTAAAIPGVTVAGKTGTAELGNAPGGVQLPGDTDAWFIAFAPHKKARVAVAVFVGRAGAGGQVAAPIARQVLITALAEN